MPSSSGLAYVLTFGLRNVPAFHSSSSCVEIGTRTVLMPRSAMLLVIVVMFADQSPWKTRSLALNPNQLVPVSSTSLPDSSTILLPETCSQSSPGAA